MKKVLVSVFAALSVLAVSALCYAAWSPVVPPVQAVEGPAAPAVLTESPPVVLETSAVLVLADRAKEAPLARPVARRAKTKYECGGWEPSQAGGAYKRCDWR
jgi:hypothetical protein